MSLDNTAHFGRPGLDELVPSRYAHRVGEIDVLVVSDGVLSLPGAMLGHNADPAVRAAWLKDMFRPPDHPHRRWDRGGVPGLAAGRAVGPATGGRWHRSRIRNRRGADPHAHGPLWRTARR